MSASASSPSAASSSGGHGHGHQHGTPQGLPGLVIAAAGVVFGDIGTSPLYTLKEAFSEHFHLQANHDTVLGILSLVFWAMMIVVTVKYVSIIMRADNEGEGGIMALMALTQRTLKKGSRTAYVVGILGIFGASLFFGDGVITPAITVLGAVEGLGVAAPGLTRFIVPITILILLSVFMVQRFGTQKVGRIFGPIMVIWFLAIGTIGVANIVDAPEVLKALNPLWGVRFFIQHGWQSILILGVVVLAVTGGEALYADMGHFGIKPIRYAWYILVLPCLFLNYLGQGAFVLEHPAAVVNPFYESMPRWALYPMIVMATLAAVIASQAVITGAFSVARQAMQLGYIPRMQIKHTSHDTIGQIYIPGINWILMVTVLAVVLMFQDSTRLAAAYGISVSATMLIDTLLLALVARALWPKGSGVVIALCVVFFVVDLGFVIANGAKFFQGAWFPVVLGIAVFTLLRTWRRGRELLSAEIRKEGIQLDTFLPGLMLAPPVRVPGTGSVPDRHDRHGAARAAAQPQAQQGAARSQRVPDRGNPAGAVRADGKAPEDRLHRRRVLPGHRQVRLHGDAGRAAGADAFLRPRRHLLRSDGDDLFRQPREHRRHRPSRHARLARQAVRGHAPQRGARHRLLPHSGQPAGRTGRAGRNLSPASRSA